MSLLERKIESLPFVLAELNYLAPTDGKPRTYAFDPPPGEPKSTALPEPHQVPVFDGRSISDSFSLDREGFALVRHPTAVRTFTTMKRYARSTTRRRNPSSGRRYARTASSSLITRCAGELTAQPTSAALARASLRPESMSIRPTHPAPIACASICLRKQMNS